MQRVNKLFLLIFIFAGALFSCKTDDTLTTLKTPENYYPLEVGKFLVYSVDSIIYHETIDNDTSSYQVKELLSDTFYDNEQRLNYKIERYIRSADTLDWTLANIWSVLYTEDQLQKVENNLRFIKMVTPVRDGTIWDGNMYLGGLDDLPYNEECNRLTYLEGWQYEYADVEQPYSINGFDFDNTLKVMQSGDSNFIWYNYQEEIYAYGVGMIQQDMYHYYTQDIDCPECPWEERVQCGYSVKMRIVEYN